MYIYLADQSCLPSADVCFTPDRRQTYVKNEFLPLRFNEAENMTILSSDNRLAEMLPSATFTPERRMTYVKNTVLPMKSDLLQFQSTPQVSAELEMNSVNGLHNSPIAETAFEPQHIDKNLTDTNLHNNPVKNNVNLSLEISANCLLLTPDNSKAKDHFSISPKNDSIMQGPLESTVSIDDRDQDNFQTQGNEQSLHISLEKESEPKDSSKDTYVVDEPSIASLADITEEGSLHDTNEKSSREGHNELFPDCKLDDIDTDDITQVELAGFSLSEQLLSTPQVVEPHLKINIDLEEIAFSPNYSPLPETLEDRVHDEKLDDISLLIANKLRLSRERNENILQIQQTDSSEAILTTVETTPVNKKELSHASTFNIIQLEHQALASNHSVREVVSTEKTISLNLDEEMNCSPKQKEAKINREGDLSPNLDLGTEENPKRVQIFEPDLTVMETNQIVKPDSFLMETVLEEDFIPPNPGCTKYCSTAYKKDRTRGESQEFSTSSVTHEKERSSEIARTLFASNKSDTKPKASVFNKIEKKTPCSKVSELASETWVIPMSEDSKAQENQSNIRLTSGSVAVAIHDDTSQRKNKPPTNLRNRVSLGPSVLKSNVTNKSINYSKMLIKKKPSNPRLTLIKPLKSRNTISHPNPHAAQNMYYDERWIEKQENGFRKWLNFVLTPPEGFDDVDSQSELLRNGKIDVAKLWSACTKDVKVPRAPTREVLSLRAYTVQREMNRLRRNACTLLQTPDVANVLAKLEFEIEKHRFEMRQDKAIHKDVGMKKKFLMLILNYNPLWLRIGLETVFGRIIPMNEAADYVSLSKFIIRDFLYNPDILAMFAHPTVPHHYSEGYEMKIKQFILKRFFNLVLFLDRAKKFQMIKHNPCLFNKDSPIKMSKDIITSFSRDFLSGEGDVMKHLGYLGYKVDHKQTHLDEFDFAVTNIAVDVRCGVRLCRLMEILTKNRKLTESLRLPASTRMQKLHNVGVALKALEHSAAGPPPEKPTSKDIVDGHLQKTLDLLWHVIFGFQIGQLLNIEHLSKEISYLEKTLNHEVRMGNDKAKLGWDFYLDNKRRQLKENSDNGCPNGWLGNERIQLLLKWSQLVCAHYGLEIENLSVSFSDGRGLCLLVHHYHSSFLPLNSIFLETTQTQQGNSNGPKNLDGSFNDSFGQTMTYTYNKSSDYAGTFEKLLKNEKENFKLLHNKTKELGGIPILIKSDEMSNTIPDQKVTTTFITYLAARLLDLSVEMQAARTIQLAWKRFKAIKEEEKMKVRYQ